MNKIISVTDEISGVITVDLFLLNQIKHLRFIKINTDSENVSLEILTDKWRNYTIKISVMEEIGNFLGGNKSSLEVFTNTIR
jgi:hypothetical protein